MLHFMRKHAKFFYVFFFLVIISFIFLYVGPIDKNQNPVVVEIGKDKVYLNEYWRAYDNLRNFYRDIYKDKFTPEMEEKLNLKEKTLQKLIEERLLLMKAADMGIYVSDEELQKAIMSEPAFQRDGVFNRNIYLRTLQLNRLTPAYYEAAKRNELILKKMRNLIEDSVDLTPLDTSLFKGNKKFLDLIKNSLLTDKKNKVLDSFVETLKKQYNVKIHSEYIS